jgi:AcrR family transcriptional regulator
MPNAKALQIRRRRTPGASPIQVAKSEATRVHVLKTTVDCLAKRPASDVSIATISKYAKVSRGGVQYHFKTRRALLAATVEYLHQLRLEQFREDLAAIKPGKDVIDAVIDTYWRHLNENLFRAYQELVLAARSDRALSAMLAPKYRVFQHNWYETARTTFGWTYQDPNVARAGEIAHYVLEGMAYGVLAGQLRDTVIRDLLQYSKNIMHAALEDAGPRRSGVRSKRAGR